MTHPLAGMRSRIPFNQRRACVQEDAGCVGRKAKDDTIVRTTAQAADRSVAAIVWSSENPVYR
jgi:hypothetical protein